MAFRDRPAPRRGPSGPWNRLKSQPQDPLEAYGLPSKGETRLNDTKAQETYYNRIVERYMKFCASTGNADELDKAFSSLSLLDSNSAPPPTDRYPPPVISRPGLTFRSPSTPIPSNPPSSGSGPAKGANPHELSTILMAMRKLRESIVSTKRTDHFAQRAYIFIIHAAILTKHMESYHPALLYLLHVIHPVTPLSASEYHEFVGYRVLDTACRVGDLAAAYALKVRHGYRDRRVESVLSALAHDNWYRFWRVRRAVDGYQKRLMEWAKEGIRMHALKCLGRSYFSVEVGYVVAVTQWTWEECVKNGVGWELEGERVVIRKPKAPAKPVQTGVKTEGEAG